MTDHRDPADQDVTLLADALLDAVQDDVDHVLDPDIAELPPAVATAVAVVRRLGIDFVRRYNRLDLDGDLPVVDEPVLFVANHGFGGIFDLNNLAIWAAFDALRLNRPVTMLTHQSAWTLGVGSLIEPFGARPAGRESAQAAFEDGHHVLVLPGGDLDAFKSYGRRNDIVFGGRRGFAKLAVAAEVPIVPIVTAGGAESALVLSDGTRLARALKVDKLLRLKAMPVSVTLPWGVSVGAAGMLPYLPLPTKLRTRVLPPLARTLDETADGYGDRVEGAMQAALDELTVNRKPLLG